MKKNEPITIYMVLEEKYFKKRIVAFFTKKSYANDFMKTNEDYTLVELKETNQKGDKND